MLIVKLLVGRSPNKNAVQKRRSKIERVNETARSPARLEFGSARKPLSNGASA
jgi:hypothetical protein